MAKTKATKKKTKAKRGRPTIYSQRLVSDICTKLAEGKSLRSICIAENMPVMSAVFRWLTQYPDFKEHYIRAREAQADAIADEILDIADDGSNDWMERTGLDQEPAWVQNGEAIRRSQVRIDARKWLAGKMAPKVYGDKTQIDANVTMSWASIVEEVAAKRLAEAKTIEGEIVDEKVDKTS